MFRYRKKICVTTSISKLRSDFKAAMDQHFAGGRWHFTTNTLFRRAGLTVKKKLEKNILTLYFIHGNHFQTKKATL